MRLVHTKSGVDAKVGDLVLLDGSPVYLLNFQKPTSPASEGKCCVGDSMNGPPHQYYVGVVGLEWIEREDRDDCP